MELVRFRKFLLLYYYTMAILLLCGLGSSNGLYEYRHDAFIYSTPPILLLGSCKLLIQYFKFSQRLSNKWHVVLSVNVATDIHLN